MASPVRASDAPFAVTVEYGKDYGWCSCGHSKNQPLQVTSGHAWQAADEGAAQSGRRRSSPK